MHAGIQRLRDNPKLGRDRQDIRRGYHSLLIGRHVVFYRFDDQECEIVRVIHDRMDVHRIFDGDPK